VLAERLRAAGCNVISADWNFAAPDSDVNAIFAGRVLDGVKPDYLHCNGDVGPAFLKAANRRGIPVLTHVRTSVFHGLENVHAAADHLIAVSWFVEQRLREAGHPAEKITVIYEGLDPQAFAPGVFARQEMRRLFSLPDDAFVITMIARVTRYKRHGLMLDAFSAVARELPAARLVFVGTYGEDDLLADLQRKCADLKLDGKVVWLPFQDDIRHIEGASDVIALPSDEEALGLCILEAMSLEIPVIVSDSGGMPELIEDGVSGLTMQAGNAVSLAEALLRLGGSADLRARLGQNARRRVEQQFTLQIHADRVEAVLQNLTRATR
jgi:glycosyltransferase involved in cell wall biosynthesis